MLLYWSEANQRFVTEVLLPRDLNIKLKLSPKLLRGEIVPDRHFALSFVWGK